MDAEIIVIADAGKLAHEAARRFTNLAREAVESRGRFSVALSGGSTPGTLYGLLAGAPYREQVPWGKVHLFWGDERSVPAGESGSNYHMADQALIRHVPIPAENVHRIQGELAPEAAARAYDKALRDFYCGPHPRFDLVLLGIGHDGHTASLFPGSPGLGERERLAQAATAIYEDRPAERVTLTLGAINTAREVLFLVSGSAKAEIVKAVLEGSGEQFPAQRVQPSAGAVTWLLDEGAASLLG
ncbi:6-phosphogluconolactonase [Chloroflexota bacterium]